MEKGFNDDELADIMNEIESLEKEFSDDSDATQIEEPKAESPVEPVHTEKQQEEQPEEVVAEEVVAEVAPVAEKIAEFSEEQIQDVQAERHDDDNIHHLGSPATSSGPAPHSSLNFSVEGEMNLNLLFNIAGKHVQLNISEGHFDIELEGGMKFSIPMDSQYSVKKSA